MAKKAGWKTSEFWVTVLAAAAPAVLESLAGSGVHVNPYAAAGAAGLYTVCRTIAKTRG